MAKTFFRHVLIWRVKSAYCTISLRVAAPFAVDTRTM